MEKALENMRGFISEAMSRGDRKEEGVSGRKEEKVGGIRTDVEMVGDRKEEIVGGSRTQEAKERDVEMIGDEGGRPGDLRHPERRRVMEEREREEERELPGVIILGWQRTVPGREEVKAVLATIGLGGIPIRAVKAGGSREQVAKVLLWTEMDKRRILRNKTMLKDTMFSRLFIKEDRYPSHWKRVEEGKEGRRREERRLEAPKKERTERKEESKEGAERKVERMRQGEERPPERGQPTERRQSPKKGKWTGPRTALFESIFEELEREEEKGQREPGNGERFLRSRRKGSAAPKWRGRGRGRRN